MREGELRGGGYTKAFSPSALLGPPERASQAAAWSQGKRPPPGVQNGHCHPREGERGKAQREGGWRWGLGAGRDLVDM